MTTSADSPPWARRLLAEGFGQVGGELCVGEVPVRTLAQAYGTPLYAVDAGRLRQRYRALVAALDGWAEVFYSVKANPQPAVAAQFVAEGAGLEIASGGELRLALAAGCAPSRVLFAGPGKGRDELALAVSQGIGEVHLESFEEVQLCEAVAREAARVQTVSLRVNPGAAAEGGAMRMGGRPTAFGFDEEQLAEAVQAVQACPHLRLEGLHVYAGTQILQAEVLLKQWRIALEIGVALAALLQRPLARIDLGGGLGIPYHPGQAALDLDAVRAGIGDLRALQQAQPGIAGAQVLVEPGRWLAGPAGVYLMGVRAVKTSRGQRFVVCDGGMHHHLAASGNLGQVIKLDYPLLAATRLDDAALGPAQVVGPLCTPLDTLGRQTPLPQALATGDLIAVLQSGAYGLTASPVGFLSHPWPAEVLVDGAEHSAMTPTAATTLRA